MKTVMLCVAIIVATTTGSFACPIGFKQCGINCCAG